ncbi:MAG: hypothetical protein E7311_03040 [Clostridiales bacterium]|nr:hypothetical protein [Clostridiales bacterium]
MELSVDTIILIVVGLIIICAIILIVGVVVLVKKGKEEKQLNAKDEKGEKQVKNAKQVENTNDAYSKSDVKNLKVEYTESFLEFDEISDNMIVQKNGDKYLMVIKCQGINYDLMSESEMIAVEEGFIQFLNTLRFPIQFYVQTSSLDLTDSLKEYKERVEAGADDLQKLKIELNRLEDFDEDNFTAINAVKYEINKKQNVYDYGKDVIGTVEKLSKSKNILQQNYYIVVPYFASELGSNEFNQKEIKEMAFEELYTRCRGLIASLAMCSVRGEVLDSFELAELLYIAYNRDEGEIYSFRNAIEAQYDRLYHTGEDIMKKKKRKIEQEMIEKAAQAANEEIIKASGNEPGDVYENNEMIQQLVYRHTKNFIKEYSGMIDDGILQKAAGNVTEKYKEERRKMREERLANIRKQKNEEVGEEEVAAVENKPEKKVATRKTATRKTTSTKTKKSEEGGK